MAIKIAIFSINGDIDCTYTSMKVANYLVGNQNKIAVIESGSTDKYKEFYITREDGIYELNNVDYVPSGVNYDEENYDIIIKDFGKVNALFSFSEEFNKIYLCEESNPSQIFEMSDFLSEQAISCDLLLFNASRDDLSTYKSYGYACVNINSNEENICSYEFSLQLSLLLRKNGMTPPEYIKDAEYPSFIYAKDMVDNSKKKKSFFSLPKKEKKQKEKTVEQSILEDLQSDEKLNKTESESSDEMQQESTLTDESVEENKTHEVLKSNPLENYNNYIKVPVPQDIELSQEEESKQLIIEKELEELQKKELTEKENFKNEKLRYKEELERKSEEINRLKEQHEKEKQSEILEQEKKYKAELIEKEKEINKLKELQQKQSEKSQQNYNALSEKEKEINLLKYRATHDPLTNVKNRAGFDEDIQALNKYLLIAFDVNDLKKTNDTYGHDKGDYLLKTIVEELSNIFDSESIYRMGGDEFDVLLSGKIPSKKEINKTLETLDVRLEELSKKDGEINFQIAYGYAYSHEGKRGTVIETADQRMYENKKLKKQGRDIEENTQIIEVNRPANLTLEKPKRFSLMEKLQLFNIKETPVFSGHISIFVTSLRHSCGTSYIAGSLASALTDIYNRDVWLDHKEGDIMPDNIMVKEILSDEDRFNAYKNGIVIFDKGLYKDLSNEDHNEMIRADVNIMVSTADEIDLRNLAAFIKKEGNMANKWLFVFNHVQPNQKSLLDTVMRNYNHLIIPQHDYSEVPASIRKEWKSAINYCITTV